ncbi:MAG: Gfo/Idh/MocA family oxidoreductase [Planctomycetaceae bacterium]
MTKIRIGVTGSGFMGRTHVEAAHRLESTEIVAVAGGSRAAKLAADYGIACEPDVETLIRRSDLDAIVISTPHWLHADEALLAAETGKHVLVEKPMATRVEDGRKMLETFRKKGLTLSVGYHQRFRDSNREAGELIQSGKIGAVRCLQTSALFDIMAMRSDSGFGGNWGWWTDPRSVAHLINSAPHTVDLCRWWFGAEIKAVTALCGTFREANPNENTTMSLLEFDNGVMATFWSSSVAASPGFPGEGFRFRFMGDEGLIDLDPFGKLLLAVDGQWETIYEQPPVGFDDSNAAFGTRRMQAYCDQMQAFVDAIRGEPEKAGSAEDGIAGVAAVIAMLESSRKRETIHLI